MLYANCLTSQNGLVDICLIRHTRPQIEAGICYGRLDLDLAKSFEQEAVLAAAVLPSGFQHVYSVHCNVVENWLISLVLITG